MSGDGGKLKKNHDFNILPDPPGRQISLSKFDRNVRGFSNFKIRSNSTTLVEMLDIRFRNEDDQGRELRGAGPGGRVHNHARHCRSTQSGLMLI